MAKTPEDRQNPANEMMENLIERGILVPEPTPPAPIAPHVVKLHTHGGNSERDNHDWLMSDGTIQIMTTEEAKTKQSAPAPIDQTDTTKADARLLPCPFCSSRKIVNWLSHDAAPNVWCVFCEECNAEGPHSNDEEEAVQRWNSRPATPAPIAAQPENPQVVTTYGVYLSVERYNRLIEYENNTKTHIKNRSILLNHAADLHEDLSKIAELVGIAKSGDLFNMSELIDAVRKLVVPAERVDAARLVTFKRDLENGAGLHAVFVGNMPVHHFNHADEKRVKKYMDRLKGELAASLKQETQPPSETLTHSRSCSALNPMSDSDCTCGLRWRIALQTEQTMHAAWRKRAEEAKARELEMPNWVLDYAIELEQIQEVRDHMLTDCRGHKHPVLMRDTIIETIRKYFKLASSFPLETPAVICNCGEPMYLRCVCGETREK